MSLLASDVLRCVDSLQRSIDTTRRVPAKSLAPRKRAPPQLILSDALLAAIGKIIKRTLADKKGLVQCITLYWLISDLYERLKTAFG